METKAYNFKDRDEARKGLGFDHIEVWSDHIYAGKHCRRLVAWSGASRETSDWYNEIYECPKTGHVVVYRPAMAGRPERGKKVLRRAIRAAVRAAGAWAEKFDGTTVYPPYIPAGIVALTRMGRRDLIPALRRRCASGRYDVAGLRDARAITA